MTTLISVPCCHDPCQEAFCRNRLLFAAAVPGRSWVILQHKRKQEMIEKKMDFHRNFSLGWYSIK